MPPPSNGRRWNAQLAGETPNTVQDILEQALDPWLKDHGYLKD